MAQTNQIERKWTHANIFSRISASFVCILGQFVSVDAVLHFTR